MIALIVLVSLISIIFIEFEMNDYAMYKEAFLVSQEIIKMTHITNTFTYSGFIKVAELFDTWPEIPNHDEVGKIKHDFIKISTNNYDNILELIIDSNVSHLKMAPPFRKDLLELTRNNYKNSKNAGVTILFHPCNNRVSFTLILRNEYDGVHSNQISLPGGSFEKNDKNIFDTALRETNEEIGIDINEVQLIRKLQNVYVPPSNYDISPFMVYTENELKFVKDISEVKEIINVDLEQLFIDSNIVKTKGSQISNRYLNTLVPAYKLNGYFVWGATAMILSEVKDIIKAVL